MGRVMTKKIEILKLHVRPTRDDHEAMVNESCSNPRTCRWNVGLVRAAEALGLGHVTKPWADAGHLAFSLNGWRWEGDTPKKMKADMLALDAWLDKRKKARTEAARQAVGPAPFSPASYTVEFRKTKRVRKATAEQLAKMSRRRKERIARGEPDKKYSQYTFHERVVGYA